MKAKLIEKKIAELEEMYRKRLMVDKRNESND